MAALPKISPRKWVVRPEFPARRGWLLLGLIAAAAFVSYACFEAGRESAGYFRLTAARQRANLESQIAERDAQLKLLQPKVDQLETLRISDTRERTEVQRSIGELQAQVARQTQELAFYKGLVAHNSAAPLFKIQQLRVAAGGAPQQFEIRLSLVQPLQSANTLAGAVKLSIDGVRAGAAEALNLSQLTAAKSRELPFSFRYVENIVVPIVLPADFKPERIVVEVRSNRKDVTPLTQTFVWVVDSA